MTSILFVEDDYYLGPKIVEMLEAKGYDVYFATNYGEACELLYLDGPFDVILTDYEFPGGNGLDVIEYALFSPIPRYHDLPAGPDPIIIIWSGLDRTDEV